MTANRGRDQEPLRVLAVDDEPRGVELLTRTLRKLAKVDVASSGEEAWALFRERHHEVVLSD